MGICPESRRHETGRSYGEAPRFSKLLFSQPRGRSLSAARRSVFTHGWRANSIFRFGPIPAFRPRRRQGAKLLTRTPGRREPIGRWTAVGCGDELAKARSATELQADVWRLATKYRSSIDVLYSMAMPRAEASVKRRRGRGG